MTGKLLAGLAAVAFLAGACLLVLNLSGSPRPLPEGRNQSEQQNISYFKTGLHSE